MLRRALSYIVVIAVLAFMCSSGMAQVPEGTVLVHAHGDVAVGVMHFDPRVTVPISSSFVTDIIAVYRDGKYQPVAACDFKSSDPFYRRLGNRNLILLRDGNAFASGQLHLDSVASGSPLHLEQIRPPITSAVLNALGTTSDKMGGPKHAAQRKLTADEQAKWEVLARSILRDVKKIPEAELKDVEHERVSALNVDGNTQMIAGELITKGSDGIAHQILLVAEPNGSELKPALAQYNRGKLNANSMKKFLPYIDVLDVDGDGADEIVAVLSLSGNRIFHRDGTRWKAAFTSSQTGECPVAK